MCLVTVSAQVRPSSVFKFVAPVGNDPYYIGHVCTDLLPAGPPMMMLNEGVHQKRRA